MVDVRDVELRYGPVTHTLDINGNPIKNSDVAVSIIREKLKNRTQEVFCVLLLDSRHSTIDFMEISRGTATSSLVHPREVFRGAIRSGAVSLILAHNHPSGNTNPSKEDIDVTTRIVKAGVIVGISVVDHIIVSDDDSYWACSEQRPDLLK